MNAFAEVTRLTVVRDASFFAVAGVTIMVAASFNPPFAFQLGAHIALLFTGVMVLRLLWLSDERIRQSEAYRAIKPEFRPTDAEELRLARESVEDILLRFAKNASGVAVALYSFSAVASFFLFQPVYT
jgi:hypothetical protein